MLRVLILIVAMIVLRPLLVGRRPGSYRKDSPYGNSLDGMLSPAQVSQILDEYEGMKVHSTDHSLTR